MAANSRNFGRGILKCFNFAGKYGILYYFCKTQFWGSQWKKEKLELLTIYMIQEIHLLQTYSDLIILQWPMI